VRSAKDWPWSNYRATAGMTAAPTWLETDWILSAFAKRKKEAQTAHRRFVSDGFSYTRRVLEFHFGTTTHSVHQ